MSDTALKIARKRAGLTQVELAAISGVSQAQISRIESGEAIDPAFSTLQRLAAALRGRAGCRSVTAESIAPPPSSTAQV